MLFLLCLGFPAQLRGQARQCWRLSAQHLDVAAILAAVARSRATSARRRGQSRVIWGCGAARVSLTAALALCKHWGQVEHWLLVLLGQRLASFAAWKPSPRLSLWSFTPCPFSGFPALQTDIPVPALRPSCLPVVTGEMVATTQ